jgi:hypothetical protein
MVATRLVHAPQCYLRCCSCLQRMLRDLRAEMRRTRDALGARGAFKVRSTYLTLKGCGPRQDLQTKPRPGPGVEQEQKQEYYRSKRMPDSCAEVLELEPYTEEGLKYEWEWISSSAGLPGCTALAPQTARRPAMRIARVFQPCARTSLLCFSLTIVYYLYCTSTCLIAAGPINTY